MDKTLIQNLTESFAKYESDRQNAELQSQVETLKKDHPEIKTEIQEAYDCFTTGKNATECLADLASGRRISKEFPGHLQALRDYVEERNKALKAEPKWSWEDEQLKLDALYRKYILEINKKTIPKCLADLASGRKADQELIQDLNQLFTNFEFAWKDTTLKLHIRILKDAHSEIADEIQEAYTCFMDDGKDALKAEYLALRTFGFTRKGHEETGFFGNTIRNSFWLAPGTVGLFTGGYNALSDGKLEVDLMAFTIVNPLQFPPSISGPSLLTPHERLDKTRWIMAGDALMTMTSLFHFFDWLPRRGSPRADTPTAAGETSECKILGLDVDACKLFGTINFLPPDTFGYYIDEMGRLVEAQNMDRFSQLRLDLINEPHFFDSRPASHIIDAAHYGIKTALASAHHNATSQVIDRTVALTQGPDGTQCTAAQEEERNNFCINHPNLQICKDRFMPNEIGVATEKKIDEAICAPKTPTGSNESFPAVKRAGDHATLMNWDSTQLNSAYIRNLTLLDEGEVLDFGVTALGIGAQSLLNYATNEAGPGKYGSNQFAHDLANEGLVALATLASYNKPELRFAWSQVFGLHAGAQRYPEYYLQLDQHGFRGQDIKFVSQHIPTLYYLGGMGFDWANQVFSGIEHGVRIKQGIKFFQEGDTLGALQYSAPLIAGLLATTERVVRYENLVSSGRTTIDGLSEEQVKEIQAEYRNTDVAPYAIWIGAGFYLVGAAIGGLFIDPAAKADETALIALGGNNSVLGGRIPGTDQGRWGLNLGDRRIQISVW